MVEFTLSHLSKNFKVDLYRYSPQCSRRGAAVTVHVKKWLPFSCCRSICSKAVGVVHRILCYQKRCKIRLVYNWKELWSGNKHYNLIVIIMCSLYQILIRYFVHLALVNLLKFFVTSEDHLLPKFNIFLVSDEVSKKSIHLTPYKLYLLLLSWLSLLHRW